MTEPLPRLLRPLTADQRETLERRWRSAIRAPAPQRPCDHGLFGDSANQLDLLDSLKQREGN